MGSGCNAVTYLCCPSLLFTPSSFTLQLHVQALSVRHHPLSPVINLHHKPGLSGLLVRNLLDTSTKRATYKHRLKRISKRGVSFVPFIKDNLSICRLSIPIRETSLNTNCICTWQMNISKGVSFGYIDLYIYYIVHVLVQAKQYITVLSQ